ncbi:hypothetical protein [Pseudomonas sp. W5-01]|uniref:hypothetical protein n=1 Tax=Pseudomonas sp. W5-01 TaxID=3097454 RepID=UPI00397D24D7
MHSKEFTKLADAIRTQRENGWTKSSSEAMHSLVKEALAKNEITPEECDQLIRMIDDANTPPPPPPPGEEPKSKKRKTLGYQ